MPVQDLKEAGLKDPARILTRIMIGGKRSLLHPNQDKGQNLELRIRTRMNSRKSRRKKKRMSKKRNNRRSKKRVEMIKRMRAMSRMRIMMRNINNKRNIMSKRSKRISLKIYPQEDKCSRRSQLTLYKLTSNRGKIIDQINQ